MLSQGVVFALASMAFAGLNDVVFKRYAIKVRSRGMYVLGVGLVWAALQAGYAWASGTPFRFDEVTVRYGLLAGMLLAGANLLLIEGLAHVNVSLGSTVYRLNTIAVVVLSVLLLGERLPLPKLGGVVLGVASVLLLYRGGQGGGAGALKFFWLVVLAALLRAGYGVLSKLGLLAAADLNTLILLAALCWVVGGAVYAHFVEGRLRITGKKVRYSLLSGLLVFCIVNALILGLQREQASIVVPLANMSFIIALVISVLSGAERLDLRKLAAMGLAAASIVLLSMT